MVRCDKDHVEKLMRLAEVDILCNGVPHYRHAQTIADGQKELEICVGLALHKRFSNIDGKLKEGKPQRSPRSAGAS